MINRIKGFWPREFEWAVGPLAYYRVHTGLWNSNDAGPGSKELQKRFVDEFKKDSVSVGLSYAGVQILKMAIERAGSIKSEKVRDKNCGGEFKGTSMGDVKFNEKGIAHTDFIPMKWWKGERKTVYPSPRNTWKLKLKPRD
jgi:ABC-type branched-subunit amino acid transport system substrate-binding protein